MIGLPACGAHTAANAALLTYLWGRSPWCGSATSRPPAARPAPAPSSPLVLFGFCFCTRPACSGFPSCRRGVANRAGRAGSSRAARTGGRQTGGDGPDLTLPGRCGSCGRRHDGKSERQPQQRGGPTNKPRDASEEPGPPPPSRTGRPLPGERPPPEEPPEARSSRLLTLTVTFPHLGRGTEPGSCQGRGRPLSCCRSRDAQAASAAAMG